MAVADIEYADGQCSGSSLAITTSSSRIQSPNFGREYSKSANCSWMFNPISSENALILTFTKLKLYLVVGSSKTCTGSYNLKLNGNQVQCDRYVNHPTTATFCKAFFSASSCSDLDEVKRCESRELTNFPVEARYESDGGKHGTNLDPSSVWGFQMNYNFVKCPSQTTASTTNEASTTISTTRGPVADVISTAISEIPQIRVVSTTPSKIQQTPKLTDDYLTTNVKTNNIQKTNNAISNSQSPIFEEITRAYSSRNSCSCATSCTTSCTTSLAITGVVSSLTSVILAVIATLAIQKIIRPRGKPEKIENSAKSNANAVFEESPPGVYDNANPQGHDTAYEETSYQEASRRHAYETITQKSVSEKEYANVNTEGPYEVPMKF